MSLSNLEKETVVIFNEMETTAEIFTYNRRMQTRLTALCVSRPDEIRETTLERDTDGIRRYVFPKRWLRVNPGPQFSEETRAEMRERGKKYRSFLRQRKE